MNRQEIWTWLAKRLNLPSVPEPLRVYLEEMHEDVVEHACQKGKDEREDLLRVARRQLRLAEDLQRDEPARRTGWEEGKITPQLGKYERERSEGFSTYLAKIAAGDHLVQNF